MDSRQRVDAADRRDTVELSLEAQVEYWREKYLEAREELERLKAEVRRED